MIFENLPSTNTPINASNLNATINLTGFIQMFAGSTAPTGWLMCDGSAVSRTTYADLFAVIGTAYGSGDGTTTFNVPDLRGRVAVGKSSDTEFDTLGETGGEKKHTLTIQEMPSHAHTKTTIPRDDTPWAAPTSGWNYSFTSGTTYQQTTDSTGGGQAHNILQPYIVTNYIIKT